MIDTILLEVHRLSMFLIDDFFRSLTQSYKDQHGWFGRLSVALYGFILIAGFLPNFLFLVNPDLDSTADGSICMTSVFVSEGHNNVQYFWFKAVFYWQNMFLCLYLAAVAVNGHSVSSCVLLLTAPTINGLFSMISMKSELHKNYYGKDVQDCWDQFVWAIGVFWILSALALSGAVLDMYRPLSSNNTERSNYDRVPNGG